MMKFLTISLLLILQLTAFGQVNDEAKVTAGNKAYETGEYESALEAYQELVDKGYHSYKLFYNLGNTYFKLGKVPHAIYYYEKAKKINPHDEDVLFNLQLANTKIADNVEEVNEQNLFERFVQWLPTDTWAIISIAFFFLFLVSLFLFFYLPSLSQKRIFLPAFVVCLLLSGITLFLAFQSQRLWKQADEAIVFEPSVTVKSAPGATGKQLFVIHEGLKVEILEETEGYAKIKLSDGNVGWIDSSFFKRI